MLCLCNKNVMKLILCLHKLIIILYYVITDIKFYYNVHSIATFNTHRYCSVYKIDAISIIKFWLVSPRPPPAIINSPVGKTMQPL